jgi:phospholipase A-2-activating protein
VCTYAYKVTGLSTYDDVPPMPKLLAKIQEFSAALGGEAALSAAEVGKLEQLSRVLGETSYYHSSSVTAAQLQPLCRAVLAWPVENLFPLYDMLRVVAIHPNGAETLAGPLRAQLQQVLLRTTTMLSSASAGSAGATTLTATRFLCNCIKSDALRTVAYSESSLTSILRSLLPHAANPAKLVRAAVSRIALNSAGFATRSGVFAKLSLSAESSALLLQCLSAQLPAESESAEVVCNCVCALGTLEVSGVAIGEKAVWRGLLLQVQERWTGQQAGHAVVECVTMTLPLF